MYTHDPMQFLDDVVPLSTPKLLDAEAEALDAARGGRRVLIVGAIGTRGDRVAALAASQGHRVCDHVIFGAACTADCHVLRGGPELGPTCATALPQSVAAWSTRPAVDVVPLVLYCWFDKSARAHRASLSLTSLHVTS